MLRPTLTLAAGGLAALAAGLPARAADAECSGLSASGRFADTTVTSAAMVEATGELPAYCEVAATIAPVEGSRIGVVYRLPERWSGKVLGLGGGGFSGNVSLQSAAAGLSRGYATMQTDTGHPVPDSPRGVMDASWTSSAGVFAWEPLTDFAHRSIHLMSAIGKEVAAAYYGRDHERAYYLGCSTGGRQGMMESQRYPDDYDGIVAGAPVYDITVQSSGFVRGQLFSAIPDRRISQDQAAAINAAVTAACDPLDGLTDGVIGDPRACDWDPIELACDAGAPADACLTLAQADAVKALYEGVTLEDGRTAAWASMPGSELGWSFAAGGPGDPVLGQQKGVAVFTGSFEYDPSGKTPEQILDDVSSAPFGLMYSANDPDLSAFIASGGKLILHHGWMDALANPNATVDYYERMIATTGPLIDGEVADHARLFMMPGTGHCGGGPGANSADWLSVLEAWVEDGAAPDRILARRVASPFGPPAPADAPELTRPLCPYPEQARHQGGDPSAADSFVCE